MYTREGIGNGSNFNEQRLSVSQTIDFPITIRNSRAIVQNNVRALEARYNAAKLQVKVMVKSAYTKVAYAIEIVHLRQEQVDLAKRVKEIAEERNKVGEISKLDVLQSSLQLAEAQNSFDDAINQLQNARYELFNSIGLNPEDQSYGIDFPDTLRYIPIEFNQDDVLESIADHPSVTENEFYIESANANLKLNKSAYLPSLTGTYFNQDFGNGYDFNGFEVGFSIPLWFAVKQQPRIKAASSNVKSMEWKLQNTVLLLKKEAEKAWHTFANSRDQIERFNASTRQESAELLALTQEAYSVGEIPLITFLEAQRTYLISQERYLTALRNYQLNAINIEQFLQQDLTYVD